MRADEQESDKRRKASDELASDSEVHIHQGHGCKSGGCARKAVELTSGDLRRVLNSGLRGREAIDRDSRSQQRA